MVKPINYREKRNMKIGYDEKADSYFIIGMTRMESGVIFMSTMRSLEKFKEAGKELLQKLGKQEKLTNDGIKDAIRAQKDIVVGLMKARELEDEFKKS